MHKPAALNVSLNRRLDLVNGASCELRELIIGIHEQADSLSCHPTGVATREVVIRALLDRMGALADVLDELSSPESDKGHSAQEFENALIFVMRDEEAANA